MTVRETLTEIVRQWGATHGAADNLPDLVADAYRAEVLREAAKAVRFLPTPDDCGEMDSYDGAWESGQDAAVAELRRMADGAAPCPDIHHGLTRPHVNTECPTNGDPS